MTKGFEIGIGYLCAAWLLNSYYTSHGMQVSVSSTVQFGLTYLAVAVLMILDRRALLRGKGPKWLFCVLVISAVILLACYIYPESLNFVMNKFGYRTAASTDEIRFKIEFNLVYSALILGINWLFAWINTSILSFAKKLREKALQDNAVHYKQE